jgi:hypothetical protein
MNYLKLITFKKEISHFIKFIKIKRLFLTIHLNFESNIHIN